VVIVGFLAAHNNSYDYIKTPYIVVSTEFWLRNMSLFVCTLKY